MGNLLQMSITSGQDTDSRQFTLAASSHRLAGETYDANGNRTSGTADGFTSVSYNILNLPETVTAGGWTINYLYSAAGAKLRERVILSASEESTTDYAGNTVFRDSVLHKVFTGSGYLETTDSLQTLLSHPGYRFFITDHLGSVRVVADSQGNVLQRNVFHPYGEDYADVYAQGGNILDGLNIGSNAQPGGEGTPGSEGTPEGEGEPEIDDPEPGASVGGGGPDEPIEDDGEEATADEAPLAWPQYYRSFNPYRFSAKEQMTVYGGSLVGSNFEPNAGLYDFGARWYAPYSARWSTPDPLSEKYYAISPYAYCAGNPVNYIDNRGDSIIVNTKYQLYFKSILTDVFQDNANRFSFSATGVLLYNGSEEGLSEQQRLLLLGMSKYLSNKNNVLIYFEKSILIKELVVDTSNYGGAVSLNKTDYPNIENEYIIIDPNASNEFDVFKVTDEYYKDGPIDPNGPPRFKKETVETNMADRFYHELGHLIYQGQRQDLVLSFNNIARNILVLPARSPDETHNKKVF